MFIVPPPVMSFLTPVHDAVATIVEPTLPFDPVAAVPVTIAVVVVANEPS